MKPIKLFASPFKLEAVLLILLSLLPIVVGLLFFILKRLWS